MAQIADLLTGPEGGLLCPHRVRAIDGRPRQFGALTFDERGECIVETDRVLQLRRLITLEGDAFVVEPVNVDAVRYLVPDVQLRDALRVGARWAVLMVGEEAARQSRDAIAGETYALTAAHRAERPVRNVLGKGTGIGRELVTFAEMAAAHKARVEGTDINALVFELRCRKIPNASLHSMTKPQIVELVLRAHGWPHAFPRYWQPMAGATKANRMSLEPEALPYDTNDVIVAPSAELPEHSVTP